jgi:hypothetical protein
MNILLEDFSVKENRKDIFNPTIGNESLLEISNDNGVRVVISQPKVPCSHIANL